MKIYNLLWFVREGNLHRRSLKRNNYLFKRGKAVKNERATVVDGGDHCLKKRRKKREFFLPKAQRTQCIECFNSFNTLISKQKLQQALKSWSNFSLILFGKGLEIHRKNFEKSTKQ